MGNLHAGHLSLVRIAKRMADRVVVTVFVNPTQFGAGEDLDSYPRTFAADSENLDNEGVDLLFAPDVADIYPFGTGGATQVSVPGLTSEFCGAGRPGHFDGVTSVVLRLFSLVQPHLAVFGQKDYQQQLVIRRMVEDVGLPVEIQTGPVIRDANGLAMSSRNSFLSNAERQTAATIYRVLRATADKLRTQSRSDIEALQAAALTELEQAGMQPEYFAIRNAQNLDPPDSSCTQFVLLAAAHLGPVRLIDNELVSTT